jgi:glycosyltransferase involved in cell wall biosynthesis
MSLAPKKVLYLITKGNFGGAQRYVFDLATNLDRNRFESVVVFGEGETLEEKLSFANIRTIRIPSLKRNIGFLSDIQTFFAFCHLIHKERPQILHLNSSKVGGLGALAGRILGVKHIVFTGHGWAFNEERPLWQKCIIGFLHWVTILLSRQTIAVSQKTATQVIHWPGVRKKIHTIHNGIENFPTLSLSEARMKLAPEAYERIWIGTISELHKNKGIDYVIRSFAPLLEKYANVIFVVIGEGEERKNLESLARELGLEKKIVFCGFMPDAQTYLSAFDIVTLTSRTEALPYTLLEAGLAKKAVVASWVGGIPEIITNNESGILLNPSDTASLSQSLDNLIADTNLRENLGSTLKEKIEKNFSLQSMVKKTEALYDR